MTVEMLGENCLLISLGKSDMERLSIDYEQMTIKNPKFKEAIKNILSAGAFESGLDLKGKKAVIEAMPHDDGCFLLVSLVSCSKRCKKFRIKKPKSNTYSFDSLDDLLNLAVQSLNNQIDFPKNTIYEMNDKFFLVTEQVCPKTENIIKEYAKNITSSERNPLIFIARLEEYGKKIASEYAIQIIGAAMTHH